MTPFNIGRRIELNDFTAHEAAPLGKGLCVDALRASRLLERVLYWTNGHPYLTQRLCDALARMDHPGGDRDVDHVCEGLFLQSRARQHEPNLTFVRDRILRSATDLASLLEFYLLVWRSGHVADEQSNPLISTLKLSGVVRTEHGCLCTRNQIYHRVFDRQWVRSNLPDAEVRRQRAAFWLGVVRTSAIAVAIVLSLVAMLWTAIRQTRNANIERAEAALLTGHQGQRINSLSALKDANGLLVNRARLRDLAVKSLALVDLKEARAPAGWPSGAHCVAQSSDFGLCAFAAPNGLVTICSATNGQKFVLRGSDLPIVRLVFSPDGHLLAIHRERDPEAELVVLAWHEDTGRINLDDPGQVLLRLENPDRKQMRSLALSHNGRKLAAVSSDQLVLLWDLDLIRRKLAELNLRVRPPF